MTEEERVEELEEKVEELTEELERVKERKTGEAKEKEVGEIQDQIKDAAEESGISRRKFMKMIGGGAAGLSAAAVLPSVSGFTFKDDKSFKFGNMSSSQTNMEVGTGGDLDMHGNDISNISSLTDVQDHINIKDRGDDRAAPDSGLSFYVDDGKLKAVDPDGNRTVPVESFSVEELSNTGLVLAVYRDADGHLTTEAFSEADTETPIQDAHDALPMGSEGQRTAGKLVIAPKGGGGGEKYQENVTIEKRIIIEGFGPATKIDSDPNNSTDPTILIDKDDAVTYDADDVFLKNIWIDNKQGGDAIKQTGGANETHLWGVNIDDCTGGYAVNIESGRRFIMDHCEIKGGGEASGTAQLKLGGSGNANQIRISNTILHDELGHGIECHMAIDADRVLMNNVFMLYQDQMQDIFRWPGGKKLNIGANNVYIGPSNNDTTASPNNEIDLRCNPGLFSNLFVHPNAPGLTMGLAEDTHLQGEIGCPVTNYGTRCTVNGVGYNGSNDPASAGDWNGNAQPGRFVKWDDGSGTHSLSFYDDQADQWRDISLS